MFIIISLVTYPASILSKVIVLKACIKHKNLVLRTFGLAIGSYIITNNSQTI